MLLEEETFREFGYYPSELKPQSDKKILVACDGCGKVRVIMKRAYRSLCTSCAQKGEKNHNWGKHRSEETKQKIREAQKGKHLSEETRKKMSEAAKGRIPWNKGLKGFMAGEKNPFFGRHHTEESREKMREKRKHQKFPKQHTKPERIWQEIAIDNHSLPFKYTGDGSFWIGKNPSVNPDFVECNGKKIAVEIFSYHHNPLQRYGKVRYGQTYEGRKKILKKYGWKLIVFWQEDLEREDAEAFVLAELKKHGIVPKEKE